MVDARRYLDLLGVVVLALVPFGVLLAVPGSGTLRLLALLPLVLFLPGYALVAALFPESGRSRGRDGTVAPEGPGARRTATPESLDAPARFALSMAASIALVGFVTLGLNFVVGIRTYFIFLGLVGITVVLALLAMARRAALPAGRSATVSPLSRVADGVRRYFVVDDTRRGFGRSNPLPFEATSRRSVLLNAFVLVTALVLLASAGFALTVPQGQSFTEFYLTAQDGNGNTTLVDARDGLGQVERENLRFVVENHEDEDVTYTVVMRIERANEQGETTSVLNRRQFQRSVAAGETWRQQVNGNFQTGEDVRLVFNLYKSEDTGGEPALQLKIWTVPQNANQNALAAPAALAPPPAPATAGGS